MGGRPWSAQLVVVTAGRDDAKRAVLHAGDLTAASEWWVELSPAPTEGALQRPMSSDPWYETITTSPWEDRPVKQPARPCRCSGSP